jgi:hypothetical protein
MMVFFHRFLATKMQKELVMPSVDPNAVILTGENPQNWRVKVVPSCGLLDFTPLAQ